MAKRTLRFNQLFPKMSHVINKHIHDHDYSDTITEQLLLSVLRKLFCNDAEENAERPADGHGEPYRAYADKADIYGCIGEDDPYDKSDYAVREEYFQHSGSAEHTVLAGIYAHYPIAERHRYHIR